jgi:hypothetical protein
MSHTSVVHVLKRIQELAEEEASGCFPEALRPTDLLAEVEEQETSLDILQNDVHKAIDCAA